MFEPFDVVQHERRAAPFRQLRQRPLEIDPIDRAVGQPVAACFRQQRRVVEPVGQLARPRRAAANVIENLVHRQPVQPRAERRLAAEALELPVRGQEDLLQLILRVRRIAEHPHAPG